jgi:hypothetical protein
MAEQYELSATQGATGGTAVADPPAAPAAPAAPAGDPPAAPPAPAAPAAPETPAAPATEPPKTDPPPAAAVDEVKYDLKLPEGVTLDAALLERTATTARARGLSQEQAQATVDLVASEITSALDAERSRIADSYQPGGAAWQQVVDGWKAETTADPKLGATPEERQAAVDRGFGIVRKYGEANPNDAQAMTEFLDSSGLGNHPAAVRFFAWLGKAAGEGDMPTPNAAQGQSRIPDGQLFYQNGGRGPKKGGTE